MSLLDLIAAADERALATAGLACLDRCVPLLTGDDADDNVLQPLWFSVVEGDAWAERLAAARTTLGAAPGASDEPSEQDPEDEARVLTWRMLRTAPDILPAAPDPTADTSQAARASALPEGDERRPPGEATPECAALRGWADACSLAALHVHRLLDATGESPESVAARRQGRTEAMSPLVDAELRRQIELLELLAEHGIGALRHALEISAEGRRVLRAAVSRRARTR